MIYIIDAQDAQKIDFDKCLESSIDTLQYSIDGQKTYISASDIDALNDVIPLEQKTDYSFTRDTEWWRESIYDEFALNSVKSENPLLDERDVIS